MSSVYGPMFNFAFVDRWILELAEKWDLTYLAEAERQSGEEPQTFGPIKSFIVANEWDGWPEEHLPCLLVVDTGLGDQPTRDGRGLWSARRLFGASLIVQAPTRKDVRWAVGLRGAAFRSLMLQHQDLEHPEHIGGLDWVDERPAPVPSSDERNIGAQIMLFYVDVKNIADEGGSPPFNLPDPPEDPYTPPDPPPVVIDPTPDPDSGLPPGGSRIVIRTRGVS